MLYFAIFGSFLNISQSKLMGFKTILWICLLISPFSEMWAGNRHFKWVDPQSQKRIKLDLDTHEMLKEVEVGVWSSRGKIHVDPKVFYHLPPYLNNHFFVLDKGRKVRITLDGTGQVYDYFPESKEIIRVDQTYHSGYNFGATLFYRKNKLYAIGGEGFWGYSNAITFFDERMKEWEILRPLNVGPKSIVGGYQGYHAQLDVFYSGASVISHYLEDEKKSYLEELSVFDFKKNQWEVLGTINSKLPFLKSKEILWTGEVFLHFYEGNIFIINPHKNEVLLYKNPEKVLRMGHDQHLNGQKIHLYLGVDGGPVITIGVEELLKNATYWGVFYQKDLSLYWLGGGFLVFLAGAIFWIIKKRNKNNSSVDFSMQEKKLLLKLLSLEDHENLTTQDLNDLLETSTKNPESQRRIRFITISEINQKLFLLYKIKNAIVRHPMEEDKRLMAYRLSSQLLPHLSSLKNKLENNMFE